jgi:MFS family permease
MFILGRTVAGLGGSGLMNGGMTVIAGAVPLEKRPCKTSRYHPAKMPFAHSNFNSVYGDDAWG